MKALNGSLIVFVAMSTLLSLPLASHAQKPLAKKVVHEVSRTAETAGKDGVKLEKGTAKDAHKAAKWVGKDSRKLEKGAAKDARKLEKGVGKTLGIR
jgi:hypothetical protein